MSTEQTLDAVFLIELVALMLEGIVTKPCRHDTHVPYVWFGDGGHPRCGVCHTKAE